jgi:hypothetical protein
MQAYQTSQYVVPYGGIFLFQYTRCSLCRFIQTSQYVVPPGGIFSASESAVSQEIPTVK